MLRSLAAWIRAAGIDIQSAHRRNSTDPVTVVRRLLADRDVRVVVDCGAHHARMTREYRRAFPRATIYAFEPTPATYAVMLANIRGLDRIVPVHAALGDRDGELEFHVKADDEQSNSALPFEDGGGGRVRVPCMRLDTFCRDKGIERVDFMKVDVEGFELAVLRGAASFLERGGVDVILAEARPEPLRPGAASLLSLSARLDSFGYHLVGFYNTIWRPDHRIDWFDAMWVSGETFHRYTGQGTPAGAVEPPEITTIPMAARRSRST